MEKTVYKKIAASVAVVFSLLTIVEGSQVLFGITQPEYIVLTPLLIYNVAMGFVGSFVGIALWLNYRWGLVLTTTVVAAHIIVLLVVGLLYLSNGAVAEHSVQAMTIRVVIWFVIALVVWKTDKTNRFNSSKI